MLAKNTVVKILPLNNRDKLFKHRSIGVVLNDRISKNLLLYSQMHIYKVPVDKVYIADTADFSQVITCHYTKKARPAIEHYIPHKVIQRVREAGYAYIIHKLDDTPSHIFEVDKQAYTGSQQLTKKVAELLNIKTEV
jgi:hypothetical protein